VEQLRSATASLRGESRGERELVSAQKNASSGSSGKWPGEIVSRGTVWFSKGCRSSAGNARRLSPCDRPHRSTDEHPGHRPKPDRGDLWTVDDCVERDRADGAADQHRERRRADPQKAASPAAMVLAEKAAAARACGHVANLPPRRQPGGVERTAVYRVRELEDHPRESGTDAVGAHKTAIGLPWRSRQVSGGSSTRNRPQSSAVRLAVASAASPISGKSWRVYSAM
jgi:hypothetical protein